MNVTKSYTCNIHECYCIIYSNETIGKAEAVRQSKAIERTRHTNYLVSQSELPPCLDETCVNINVHVILEVE
jgi:hypothetical protein